MKRWTKREIKEMCSAIDSAWICNRPLDHRGWAAFEARFATALALHRQSIVVDGIASLRDLIRERAATNATTAEHFRTHPAIYGVSTPEMIERFEGFAAEERKAVEHVDRLLARIETEGLPPEVEAHRSARKE